MSTKILFKKEARKAVKAGFDKVADLVKLTMGPRGGNVIIDPGFGSPIIANDAKTIGDSINLPDKFENMGANIARDLISKMEDGRSSALSFGQRLLDLGTKQVERGVNPMLMRKGIEAAGEDIIEELERISEPISTDEEIRQVAAISSESEEIGKIVGDTIKKIGMDGIVTVEESQKMGIESEIVEGIEIDRGYVSPYMITDIDRMEAIATDAPILITDKVVSNLKEILPIMQKVGQSGKMQMVIIAEDITGDALKAMILSKLSPNGLNVIAIKSPGFGDNKKELLGDIAVMVGTNVVTDSLGMKLEDVELAHLGTARRVVSTKETTTIIDGKGTKEKINERVAQLKAQREGMAEGFALENVDGRIANLVGGIAVIKVGSATETEIKYLKLKIEDAVKATKGAIKFGVVPGGGVAFIKAKQECDDYTDFEGESPEFVVGYKMLLEALEAPLRQILINAGYKDKSWFGGNDLTVDEILESIYDGDNVGYDAKRNVLVEDMHRAGIIDSLKVVQNAVLYSASAVGILLTTGGASVNSKDE